MDKTGYWKNRKKGLRGQGENASPKVYPKGEKVTFIKNGEEKEFPNAEGSHMITVGRGFKKVNRTQARRNEKSGKTLQTKPGRYYEVETDELNKKGEKIVKRVERHTVGEHEHPKLRSPSISNHTAHRERQIARMARKETT